MKNSPVFQLILARLREFFREPEAVFWVYGFPIVMSVLLGIDDLAAAERTFYALAEGGTVVVPLREAFWAIRYGMVIDQFGIPWEVNCERPP